MPSSEVDFVRHHIVRVLADGVIGQTRNAMASGYILLNVVVPETVDRLLQRHEDSSGSAKSRLLLKYEYDTRYI